MNVFQHFRLFLFRFNKPSVLVCSGELKFAFHLEFQFQEYYVHHFSDAFYSFCAQFDSILRACKQTLNMLSTVTLLYRHVIMSLFGEVINKISQLLLIKIIYIARYNLFFKQPLPFYYIVNVTLLHRLQIQKNKIISWRSYQQFLVI